VVNSTPLSLYPWGTDTVAILQEGMWAPGTAWTDAEKLAQQGFEPGSFSP